MRSDSSVRVELEVRARVAGGEPVLVGTAEVEVPLRAAREGAAPAFTVSEASVRAAIRRAMSEALGGEADE